VREARTPSGVCGGVPPVQRYFAGGRAMPRLPATCCLIGVICLTVSLSATLSGASVEPNHPVAELDAAYTATLLGFPIGKIHWTIDIDGNRFSAAATGETAGLLQIFARGHGVADAHGSVAGRQPAPANFMVDYTHDSASEKIKIAFSNGKAREFLAPQPKPNPSLVPLTEAYRTGVVDPMTALIVHVPGSGNTSEPAACQHKTAVFDGRMRYDMGLAFKRIEQVKASTGYQGPVVVCAIDFTPIAGYDPNRYAIKYLKADRGMELWLAPLSGTRLMAPFRVSVPTPIGVGILQATRFVWTPQNAR
jgi:hypothetical protein